MSKEQPNEYGMGLIEEVVVDFEALKENKKLLAILGTAQYENDYLDKPAYTKADFRKLLMRAEISCKVTTQAEVDADNSTEIVGLKAENDDLRSQMNELRALVEAKQAEEPKGEPGTSDLPPIVKAADAHNADEGEKKEEMAPSDPPEVPKKDDPPKKNKGGRPRKIK